MGIILSFSFEFSIGADPGNKDWVIAGPILLIGDVRFELLLFKG